MRSPAFCLLTLTLACSSTNDGPGGQGGTPGATGGFGAAAAPGNGGAAPQAGAGLGGGGANGTSGAAGAPATSGSAGAGNGGTPSGGTSAVGGVANGGSGGTPAAGNGGTGGAAPTAGSGGAGGCVANLACKLNPPPSTGDLHQDCVDRINQFLTQCACLPALTRRTDGEDCADQMAEYDAMKNQAHAGVTDKICQPGGAQNSCPGYSSNAQVIGLCMQQMWDEGPPPTSTCTGDCYQTHGHFINMTDPDVTKVACGFHTTSSGKVWAVQNFTR
jgi:Cysteine-rich secretory protein family